MYFDKNASPKFRLSQRASQSQPVVKMSFERWKRSSKRSRISCAIIERQFISFFCVCRTTSEAQGRLLFSTVRVIYERPPRISAPFNLNKDATTCAYLCPSFEKPLHFHEEQGLGEGEKTELVATVVLQSSWNGNRRLDRWNSTTCTQFRNNRKEKSGEDYIQVDVISSSDGDSLEICVIFNVVHLSTFKRLNKFQISSKRMLRRKN